MALPEGGLLLAGWAGLRTLSRTLDVGRRELHRLTGGDIVLARSTAVLTNRNLVGSSVGLPVAGVVASVVFERHLGFSLKRFRDRSRWITGL